LPFAVTLYATYAPYRCVVAVDWLTVAVHVMPV
jgi:hypothetical protein